MDDTDKIKLREFEDQFMTEIENWRRWGRKRDWLPPSWGTIIGKHYIPRNRESERNEITVPIDERSALKMERIVCQIPDLFKQAFVLHYVGRGAVNGKMKVARTKNDGARAMGLQRRQYYNRLNKAAVIITRQW